MNRVIIKGRLTHDPELSNTSTGIEYCNFSVAVDRYVGKDKQPETDFIPCKAWRQSAVFITKYFNKGKEILVEGSIHFDKYEKDGEKRIYASVSAERVEFCGGKSDFKSSADIKHDDDASSYVVPPQYVTSANDVTDISNDDDLPF